MGTLFNKTLCVFTFENFGEGIVALSQSHEIGSVEVIEIVHRGQSTDLILLLDPQDTVRLDEPGVLFAMATQRTVINEPDQSLLKIFFNTENSNILGSILIFESQNLGSIFEFAQQHLRAGWKPVDFRYIRSSNASGYIILTREAFESNKTEIDTWAAKGRVSLVENPSKTLKNYYNLVPLS